MILDAVEVQRRHRRRTEAAGEDVQEGYGDTVRTLIRDAGVRTRRASVTDLKAPSNNGNEELYGGVAASPPFPFFPLRFASASVSSLARRVCFMKKASFFCKVAEC